MDTSVTSRSWFFFVDLRTSTVFFLSMAEEDTQWFTHHMSLSLFPCHVVVTLRQVLCRVFLECSVLGWPCSGPDVCMQLAWREQGPMCVEI